MMSLGHQSWCKRWKSGGQNSSKQGRGEGGLVGSGCGEDIPPFSMEGVNLISLTAMDHNQSD